MLGPSPVPYTPGGQVPEEMDRDDMDRVRDTFVEAARAAREARFDLLQLHMAHGYLLGSFLSPLSNQRDDGYGGPLEDRLRYPVEVFDAVRSTWEGPLSVAINATDWEAGGLSEEEGVEVSRVLRERGCDLVEVLAGQTTPRARPRYGRAFLAPHADRIRNQARVPVLVGGGIATSGLANTILAGGRTDLCLLALSELMSGYV